MTKPYDPLRSDLRIMREALWKITELGGSAGQIAREALDQGHAHGLAAEPSEQRNVNTLAALEQHRDDALATARRLKTKDGVDDFYCGKSAGFDEAIGILNSAPSAAVQVPAAPSNEGAGSATVGADPHCIVCSGTGQYCSMCGCSKAARHAADACHRWIACDCRQSQKSESGA